MSSALPKACSETFALGLPFMPRHGEAEICLISTTGEPNQRIAAGCTEPAIQRSSSDTIGHASVAGGLTATGVNDAVAGMRAGPNGPGGGGSRADGRGASRSGGGPSTSGRRSEGSGGEASRGEATGGGARYVG